MHVCLAVLFSFVHSSFKSTHAIFSIYACETLIYPWKIWLKGERTLDSLLMLEQVRRKVILEGLVLLTRVWKWMLLLPMFPITDGVATSNDIDTTVKDGEMPFPSTAPVCETKLADTIEKIQENSRNEAEKKVTGYRIIYMEILLTVFSLVASPKCGKKLILREAIFWT